MAFLQAENLTRMYGEKVLFNNISFSISDGQKIALVARNGAGKSTLLRILAGIDTADSGTVTVNRHVQMAYLPQEPELQSGKTVLECLLADDNKQATAVREYEEILEKQIADPSDKNTMLLQDAMTKMDTLDAWDYERKVKEILNRLNVFDLNQPVNELSGGQKKRVALAAVLIKNPQLLIMDEPTNHLDLEMTEWLEEYLSKTEMSLLLVTHDRYFLERVTRDIIELEHGELQVYKGTYSQYLEKKALNVANTEAERDKARNLLRKELEWMRRQPKARTTKSQSRIDAFYDLQDKAKAGKKHTDVQLEMKMSRMGSKILDLKQINKSYDDKVMLRDFSYSFRKGERLGIVGPNGVGKSTFLNLISGLIPADSGEIITGETLVFGYYTQQGLQLKEDKKVIEVVTDIAEVIPGADGRDLTAMQFLQHFGFEPAMQHTWVSRLSGGERRRLYLLTVLVKNPNFLILDEPTNDLDLVTLQTLEEFLLNFPGCLIVVTHDRYFLDRLAEHLFIFEGEGKISDFNGTYSEYRQMLKEEERAKLDEEKSKSKKAPQQSPITEKPVKKKATFKEQKEFEQLEKDMEKLEAKKSELEGKLTSGQGSHDDFKNWGAELEAVMAKLSEKEMRWLELSELM